MATSLFPVYFFETTLKYKAPSIVEWQNLDHNRDLNPEMETQLSHYVFILLKMSYILLITINEKNLSLSIQIGLRHN